jgi:drug/metabolite transporter (DMT)-like permease
MLVGVAMALLASLAWAVSSIIVKLLTERVDTLSINTLRLWIGTLLLITFIVLSGKSSAVFDVPLQSLIYVVISGILAMAIGDTIYIRSLSMLDASVAFPVAQCAFVVMAGTVAILWLDEPYTWITVVGAILVMSGIYLIATGGGKAGTAGFGAVSKTGVAVTLFAAAIWTCSTVTLKIGSEELDAFVVAAIRITVSAAVLTLLSLLRRRRTTLPLKEYGLKTLLLVAAAGTLSYGVAAVSFVLAIQMIGAGKTVLLTSTSPLFVLPFSILFLKERPSRATLVGIATSVVGVYLVVT